MNFHRVRQLLARFLFVESSSIRNFESRTRITILNTLSRVHLSRFKRLVREEKREREEDYLATMEKVRTSCAMEIRWFITEREKKNSRSLE